MSRNCVLRCYFILNSKVIIGEMQINHKSRLFLGPGQRPASVHPSSFVFRLGHSLLNKISDNSTAKSITAKTINHMTCSVKHCKIEAAIYMGQLRQGQFGGGLIFHSNNNDSKQVAIHNSGNLDPNWPPLVQLLANWQVIVMAWRNFRDAIILHIAKSIRDEIIEANYTLEHSYHWSIRKRNEKYQFQGLNLS